MFLWIWQLQNEVNKYGGIDSLINYLKSINIEDVCIKYHEGSSVTGGGINFKADFLKYVNNFKNAGFKVGTWGYNYFNYIQTESNLIIEAINNSDYYIFDVEDHVVNKFDEAEQVCSIVRNACPNACIGYSSFPIVSYHLDIPYVIFNNYCDFASPQCYWGEMQWSVNKCIDTMLEDYESYGLDKPIYPSIQTYGVSGESYDIYAAYKFYLTGGWSLDEIDSTFESFAKRYIDGGRGKLKNIIICGVGPDQWAAGYLADYLHCPVVTKENLTQDVLDIAENVFMVGGTWKPTPNTILLSGKNRYATMQAVLDYIGQ